MPHGVCTLTRLAALALAVPESSASNSAMLVLDYKMFRVVALHWTLVRTLALVVLIVRMMKEARARG